jgi:hypothetical protein
MASLTISLRLFVKVLQMQRLDCGIELKAPDLNRVHSTITEIDIRRVFYACG